MSGAQSKSYPVDASYAPRRTRPVAVHPGVRSTGPTVSEPLPDSIQELQRPVTARDEDNVGNISLHGRNDSGGLSSRRPLLGAARGFFYRGVAVVRNLLPVFVVGGVGAESLHLRSSHRRLPLGVMADGDEMILLFISKKIVVPLSFAASGFFAFLFQSGGISDFWKVIAAAFLGSLPGLAALFFARKDKRSSQEGEYVGSVLKIAESKEQRTLTSYQDIIVQTDAMYKKQIAMKDVTIEELSKNLTVKDEVNKQQSELIEQQKVLINQQIKSLELRT